MSEHYADINGHRAVRVLLTVPANGPWFADVDMDDEAPGVTGRVTLTAGGLVLQGTVVPSRSGTDRLQRRVQVVAGGGGWGSLLTAKHYHNDARVKARTVAEDAARLAGEVLGTFSPAADRVGADYVREAGPASRVLEDVIGGAAWWVDYDGVTHVGQRVSSPVAAGVDVVQFDPRERVARLSVDAAGLGAVGVGSVLTARLDEPQTVRDLEILISAEDQTVTAWCGELSAPRGRLAELFAASVARVTDARLFGKYRFRVVRMSTTRVELQAVNRLRGLPDALPISVWPGVPGVHAELTPGAEVLIEFIAGDRTQPILTGFAGADGVGFVPVLLTLGGTTGPAAARSGDAVEVLLPPAVFSGTIGGSPASGVVSWLTPNALGAITAGSSRVRVAS